MPRKEYLKYKEVARALVHERLLHWNAQYQYSYGRVAIRDSKSRWGSCSRKRNLNFNYRLALLPQHLVDYVIVHELCHLEEFNHSRAFWILVAKTIPDWKKSRRELRAHSTRPVRRPDMVQRAHRRVGVITPPGIVTSYLWRFL